VSSLSAPHEQIWDDNDFVQLIPLGFDCIVIDGNRHLILTQVTYISFQFKNSRIIALRKRSSKSVHTYQGLLRYMMLRMNDFSIELRIQDSPMLLHLSHSRISALFDFVW
jgi:hypothetical protein